MSKFSNYEYLKNTVPEFLETKRSTNGYVIAIAGLSVGVLLLVHHYRKQLQFVEALKAQNDLLLKQLKAVQLHASNLETKTSDDEPTSELND